MASLANRLARLATSADAVTSRRLPQPPGAFSPGRPTIDDLRDRIARIVARDRPTPVRADPTAGELPFLVEHTPKGPLYVRRARCGPAARVGRAPLCAARAADPAMLAMLAMQPALRDCDPRRALYIDTETTG